MKKKGFTLIELIVSFCLVSAIVIILFQLVFTLKELYVSGDIKTMMLNKQGIMTRKIYEELNSKDLTEIEACGISCLTFKFGDGSSSELVLDVAANTITYGNYTMQLSEGSYIGDVEFETGVENGETGTNITTDNRIFKISIPIESKILDDDFGIYIIKTYRSDKLIMTNADTISLANAYIMANNVKLSVETRDVPTLIDYTVSTSATKGYFMKIYNEENEKFSENETLKYFKEGDSNFSSLLSIESFKSTTRKSDVIEKLKENVSISSENNQDQDIINKASEHLQNGYYEIVYGTDSNINKGSYFIQGNNVTKKTSISEFIALEMNGATTEGISYDNFITNGPNNKKLWVRVDDYIEKYGFVKLNKIK